MEDKKIIEVENLSVSYHTYAGEVQCVRDISFQVHKGECLAIVGESGCGKTVTVKSLLGLIRPPYGEVKEKSRILIEGQDVTRFNEKEWSAFRGNKMAMIFQDALAALNPTMRIGKQIEEVLLNHRSISKKEANEMAIQMLKCVGVPEPEKRVCQYPHEFSGGMRQRAMIAMMIANEPELLIADEPTTALDVTIQGQILDLMRELQKEKQMSLILVTHDLGVVAGMAQRVLVMYAGTVVEQGEVREIFYHTKHPYTTALLKSQPSLLENKEKEMQVIEGMPPDLLNPPKGCAFCDRCKSAMNLCKERKPELKEFEEGHFAACWLYDEEVNSCLKEMEEAEIHG
ncbi:MAG: ABC transporter ATP-binding protein [Dorea sp.]|nr:ABC transporter ATP-binding protein [Dorea sp.]